MTGYDYRVALHELRVAATNWSAFIKHDCEITDATFGPGTARGLAFDDCLIAHLRTRNNRLQQLLIELKNTRNQLLQEGRQDIRQQGDVWVSCKRLAAPR